jgi:hypothetical protein
VGAEALFSNDFTDNATANNNTAVGWRALRANADAGFNTAVGSLALRFNDISGNGVATFNDAVGASALINNIDGFGNKAFGGDALFSNQFGAENTAIGDAALALSDASGLGLANNNTAVGGAALFFDNDGSENTVVGAFAGLNIVDGFNNTYLGNFIGSCVDIGCSGPVPNEDSTIRIGDLSSNGTGSLACFIGGIFNNFQPVGGAIVEVTLDLNTDQLGWDVGPSQGMPNVPTRGAPGQRGKPAAPAQRPTSKNEAMLNDKVDKLQVVVQMQQKQIVALTTQLKQQATQIDKVSAQLEMLKPAPRVVENR